MPTVNVSKEEFFALMGRRYTEKELEELCFSYGLEFDGETSKRKMAAKERGEDTSATAHQDSAEDILLRIEVPANRYDLLCVEGLALALNTFAGKELPRLVSSPAKTRIAVTAAVSKVRPVLACAVIRGVKFTKASFASFIDLQDKLHQTICKKRALASIGTHDLSHVKGPFTYDARKPSDIKFVPLRGTAGKEVDGCGMMAALESDLALREYLPLIRDSPVYPVIVDSCGNVMSVPPIINGSHSAMSHETKDVFVEVTAMDATKADIVLTSVVCLFSMYATAKWSVEQVDIVNPDGSSRVCPDLTYRTQSASVDAINMALGLKLDAAQQLALLRRMGVPGKPADSGKKLVLEIPPIRSDILHECDVIEDVAVAYGFNNLKPAVTPTPTVGHQLESTKLTDLLSAEIAMAGYTEAMTWILCSTADNSATLSRPNDGSSVLIANSKTVEFQTARTTLMTGLLRCVSSNKAVPLPIRVFEIGDVVLKVAGSSPSSAARAVNERRLCAVTCGATSGFDGLHGLLDRVMYVLGVPSVLKKPSPPASVQAYSLKAASDPAFISGLCAEVFVGQTKVGVLGVVHPAVLARVGIDNPCSALEISLTFPRGV